MARWTGRWRPTLYEAAQSILVRSGAMVLAQALGDEDRQVSRHEKSDCRAGATAGRNHAPHLWTGRALQGNFERNGHFGPR